MLKIFSSHQENDVFQLRQSNFHLCFAKYVFPIAKTLRIKNQKLQKQYQYYIIKSYYVRQMSKKLKVACLHGYGTNAKFLQRQMRSFKRAFDKQMEFVFLEGTFEAPKAFILDQKVIAMIDGETRAWNPLTSYKYNQEIYGKQVLEAVQKKYFQDEEYDGIIGFSQGAVMTHFIVKLAYLGKINWKGLKNIKFCILVCGNHWNWDQFNLDFTSPILIPSIHLISETDFLYRKSIYTTTQFKDPLVIHHDFGHSFPRLGKEQFNLIRKYINNAVKNKKQSVIQSKLSFKLTFILHNQ